MKFYTDFDCLPWGLGLKAQLAAKGSDTLATGGADSESFSEGLTGGAKTGGQDGEDNGDNAMLRGSLDKLTTELNHVKAELAGVRESANHGLPSERARSDHGAELATVTAARDSALHMLDQLRTSTAAELAEQKRGYHVLEGANTKLEQQLHERDAALQELKETLELERVIARPGSEVSELAASTAGKVSEPGSVAIQVAPVDSLQALAPASKSTSGAANLARLLIGDMRIGRVGTLYLAAVHALLLYILARSFGHPNG